MEGRFLAIKKVLFAHCIESTNVTLPVVCDLSRSCPVEERSPHCSSPYELIKAPRFHGKISRIELLK
jgi:hypothetical protein